MNNNLNRITKGLAEACKECISVAYNDPSAKKEQAPWVIESNISNEVKRDGFHIALGKNTFIKSDVPVDDNPRISRIPVKSSIIWKGGKKIVSEGETIDLKNFSYLSKNISSF